MVEIAPERLELVDQGPIDGAEVFDPVRVDLLALSQAFCEPESFEYDPGSPDGELQIRICGKVGEQGLVASLIHRRRRQ
jgi:hypothetical protein